MSARERMQSVEWPRLLLPAAGQMPPWRAPRIEERVLHLALRDYRERQPGLATALQSIATAYADVDWQAVAQRDGLGAVAPAVVAAAMAIRPTLVFLQLQLENVLTPADILALRRACDPSAVIISWDGDQHHEPEDRERGWYVNVGRVCDASLLVSTGLADRYASLGVVRPGYLNFGVDGAIYRPTTPREGTPGVVFLAANYPHIRAYDRRVEAVRMLTKQLGPAFGVYGNGWQEFAAGHPWLRQDEEAEIYSAAKLAISISIRNDLPRYTCDRPFRAMASGCVTLIERFPDCGALGFEDGVNCFLWSEQDELLSLVRRLLDADLGSVRRAAAELVRECHTWQARMGELEATVDAIREDRKWHP